MRYVRPLRSGDRFRGTCRVAKATAARVVFEQQLWLLPPRQHAASGGSSGGGGEGQAQQQLKQQQQEEELLVLDAQAVVVSLDSHYKPRRIDARLRQLLVTGAAPPGEGGLSVQELL